MLLTRWLELERFVKETTDENFSGLSLLDAISEAERVIAEKKECVHVAIQLVRITNNVYISYTGAETRVLAWLMCMRSSYDLAGPGRGAQPATDTWMTKRWQYLRDTYVEISPSAWPSSLIR